LTAEVGEEIGARRPRFGSTPERHRRAVRQTLSWAEGAAAEGDYATALSWLATLEAAEGELPPGVGARRREWASHVAVRPGD
jgi:hypothetical protein